MLGCSSGVTQVKGTPDLNVSEARKGALFPPTGVKVKAEGKLTRVSWTPVGLDTIVGYAVYRRVGNAPFARIGNVPQPPSPDPSKCVKQPSTCQTFFNDPRPYDGSTDYAVSAISTYNTESPLALPAKKRASGTVSK
jgi:hypothetical protein